MLFRSRMEMALTMSSKNLREFDDSLKYVKDEAMRLGLTSVDLGKAFAQVNIAAEGLSQDQKKRMFTGVNEYMATVKEMMSIAEYIRGLLCNLLETSN